MSWSTRSPVRKASRGPSHRRQGPTARESGRWYAATLAHVVRSVALDKELGKFRSGPSRT